MRKALNRTGSVMNLPAVIAGFFVLIPLFLGCQSQPTPAHKPTKAVVHCLKAPETEDKSLSVVQWKWHTREVKHQDVGYFTFRYTPDSDDPCSYDSIRALICERYVTSHTASANHCQFAGKDEPITEIVINAEKIVHMDVGASGPLPRQITQCGCPSPTAARKGSPQVPKGIGD